MEGGIFRRGRTLTGNGEAERRQINAALRACCIVRGPCMGPWMGSCGATVRRASLVAVLLAVTCDDPAGAPAMIANMALALAGLIDYTDL